MKGGMYEGIIKIKKLLNPFYWFKRWHEDFYLKNLRHKIVSRFILTDTPILDVGGTKKANIGSHIKNKVFTLNIAKEFKPNILGDACKLPIYNKQFHTVVVIQVFHQIPEDKRQDCLNELKRITQERVILHLHTDYSAYYYLKRTLKHASFYILNKGYRLIIWDR